MNYELQAASGLLASCALIVLVTCAYQNLRSWGKVTGAGDYLAGALFGLTSVAQMFQPIEPLPGFIFDLRNIPIALAGAFLGWRATLLAASIAALARVGIGGTGMWTGILVVFYAGGAGLVWKHLKARRTLPPLASYLLLGALTTTSLLIGLLLPEPIRTWFFRNAAPILACAYLTLLPLLAWIGMRGIVLDTLDQQTARATLRRQGIELLSLSGFIHQMRLESLLGRKKIGSAVLSLRISNVCHLKGRHSQTHLHGLKEAVLLRLAEHWPDLEVAGAQDDDTMLIPLGEDQVKRIDSIRDRIKDALHSAPFRLSRNAAHWVTYDLGLIRHDDFLENGRLVPHHLARGRAFDYQTTPIRNARRTDLSSPDWAASDVNAELLFLKARMLMDEAA